MYQAEKSITVLAVVIYPVTGRQRGDCSTKGASMEYSRITGVSLYTSMPPKDYAQLQQTYLKKGRATTYSDLLGVKSGSPH